MPRPKPTPEELKEIDAIRDMVSRRVTEWLESMGTPDVFEQDPEDLDDNEKEDSHDE